MKSQTLILFVLALGLTQCVSPPIEWVGDWEFKSSTLPEECIPQSIVSSSLGPQVVFKWIWASTQGCKDYGLDGLEVVRVKFPTSNTLYLINPSVGVPLKFTLNGNSALVETVNDAESIFEKKVSTPSVDWAGTWNIQTKSSSEECFPKDKITVLATDSTITLLWIWDLTEACSKRGLAGTFYETTVAMTNGDITDFFFPFGDEVGAGTFSVSGDTATFKGLNKLSCHLERETPQQINWDGTWDLKIISSATSCLPNDKVTVTSSDSSVTYSWNWDSNEICKQAGLSRKSFTKTISTPTGNSVTLQDGEVSVTLSLNGDTIFFVSQSGGSGTFARQTGTLSASWTGNWIFKSTTQPEECIPKKIDTSVSGSQVIVEWTWDSTQGCKDHFIDDLRSSKMKLPIENEIIVEPSSAKVPFKFILDEGTAIAETGVDAKSTFERKTVTPSVDWVGTWIIKSRASVEECYPKDKITVSTKDSFIILSWVWDLTEPCSKYGLAGVAHESIVAIDNSDTIKLPFILGKEVGSGSFSVRGNSATFRSFYIHFSCELIREGSEVNWDGTWILKSTSSPTSCYPKEQAVISKFGFSLTFSWIWDSTEGCKKVGLDGKPFAKTIQTPTGNSATLHYLVGETEVVGTFSIEGDSATFKRENDDSCSFDRQLEPLTVEWAGTWNLKTTSSANACYPKEKIIIATKSTTATYSWVWDTNENCEKVGLSGKNFEKEKEIPESNSVILKYDVEGAEAFVILNVNGDIAQFSTTQNDASSTFARHIPVTNWAGTWILKTTSTASCYPKEQIYVSSSEDSVTYSWVWDSNDNCKQFELSGKPFTKTVPTPKGNSVTLNFIVQGSETSVIFTVNEDKATFKGLKEASCTFDRQTEKPDVNWAGSWIIKTTSSSELCYPKKKITISKAEASSLTFNWVWDSSQGCTKLGLADKTFEKTTSVPNGNLVPLHFLVKEVESYGILTIDGDKANLNNLDGASCTFEREIEKKGGSFIIWLIIALVLVGGVGFFFYRKRQQDELAKNLTTDSPSKSLLPA